jgi:outer membrane immunogenic protein
MQNSRFAAALVIGIIVGVNAACAADMAVKARPIVAPVAAGWNWTGLYVGGNIGGGWSDDQTLTAADPFNTFGLGGGPFLPAVATRHGSGIVGGVHAGFNWQVSRVFLLGVEADVSGADVNFSTRVGPLVSTFTNSDSSFVTNERVRALASIRGRAGLTFGDWLLFGTAGWGWADTGFSADATCAPTGTESCKFGGIHAPVAASFSRNGAVYGGGIDFHVPNTQWVIGGEFLRYDLGSSGLTGVARTGEGTLTSFGCPAGTPCVNYTTSSLHLNEASLRASYQFGGPIVAKY